MTMNRQEFYFAILGGVIAQLTFEFYAWIVSPVIFGPALEPANLVMGLAKKYAGLGLSYEAAFTLHAFIGTVGFGVFTLLFYKLCRGHAILSGVTAGVALWFIAQGMLAPAMGREFMMGFGAYTQSSFVGHVGMTVIIALFLDRQIKSKRSPT